MSTKVKKTPEVIDDSDLDQAIGGSGPKLTEASAQGTHMATSGTPVSILDGTSAGRIDARGGKIAGDGSV